MLCNFKTIDPTIRSLVISEKICLILITLQLWHKIKKGKEEINSSWLNRVLSEMEIRLEGFSESRTKFVSYFGHPLKPREATVRSEVVFCHFCRMKIPAQVFNRTLQIELLVVLDLCFTWLNHIIESIVGFYKLVRRVKTKFTGSVWFWDKLVSRS